MVPEDEAAEEEPAEVEPEEKPIKRKRSKKAEAPAEMEVESVPPVAEEIVEEKPAPKKGRGRKAASAPISADASESEKVPVETEPKKKSTARVSFPHEEPMTTSADTTKESIAPPEPKVARSKKPTRSRSASPVRSRKVLFTGFDDSDIQKKMKILAPLGLSLTANVHDADIIVSDKLKRTIKMLHAITCGKSIVGADWVEACKRSKSIVEDVLVDKEGEEKFSADLGQSLRRAKERKVLQGLRIYITKSVLPAKADLKEVITLAGGEYVGRVTKKDTSDIIVISDEQDKKEYGDLKARGFQVFTKDFLLNGIVRQELNYTIDLL